MSRFLPVLFATCVVICTGAKLPQQNGQVLKELPEEILFRAGTELVLECKTVEKSQAPIKYAWFKNGKLFELSADVTQRESEGTIVFKNPGENDEGKYQCFAQSASGTASTRLVSVKFTYFEKPEVVLEKHKPVEGKPYFLNCPVTHASPWPEISWLYQSISDPTISRKVLDKRITISSRATLYFSNVTKEDTSDKYKYVCVGRSPAVDSDVVLAEHVLEDVVPNDGQVDNELVEQFLTYELTARLGNVTSIYCIYGGTPLAHPDWYKDGKNVNNSPKDRVTRYNRTAGKRLLIKETWLEDEGTYTCIVDNGVGKPQNHSIYLRVVSAPEFTAKPPPKQIITADQDITIPCKVASVPAPKITWTYNAKALPENDKLVVSQTVQGNVTVADLTIKNVQNSDTGYYGCRAVNEYGDIYAETLLKNQ